MDDFSSIVISLLHILKIGLFVFGLLLFVLVLFCLTPPALFRAATPEKLLVFVAVVLFPPRGETLLEFVDQLAGTMAL